MNEQKIILSLIKDDLTNTKLVLSLNALGLQADHYSLQLSATIFELMGFEDDDTTEPIFERYIEHSKTVTLIGSYRWHEQLEELAQEIYAVLISERKLLQIKNAG